MSTTKYIVNNLSGQTIDNQPIIPTYKKFVGLLTSSPQTLTSGTLVVGETYEIINYSPNSVVETISATAFGVGYPDGGFVYNTSGGNGLGLTIYAEFSSGSLIDYYVEDGGIGYLENDTVSLLGGDNGQEFDIQSIFSDDFFTVAEVISGVINQNGCVFRATSETPDNWSYGTELQSYGVPLESNGTLKVLENTLNMPLSFSSSTSGQYVTISNNLFTSGNTYWNVGQYDWLGLGETNGGIFVKNMSSNELTIETYGSNIPKNGLLSNTPIEIIKYN